VEPKAEMLTAQTLIDSMITKHHYELSAAGGTRAAAEPLPIVVPPVMSKPAASTPISSVPMKTGQEKSSSTSIMQQIDNIIIGAYDAAAKTQLPVQVHI